MSLKKVLSEEITTLRNPFESWFFIKEREERKLKEKEMAIQEPFKQRRDIKLQLKGILTGKRNLAIINEEILGEGEIIEGKKVLRIEKKKVVLQGIQEKEEVILELADEF
ncbi:MAG: hypothetical protein NC818_03030 [Candidatus Omnitrophica bacterium]|nr:hypothetical protein [Candidatus Omnitrophota bacterium]